MSQSIRPSEIIKNNKHAQLEETYEQTSKLDQLVQKFKSFEDRIKSESDLLTQDINKFILQAQFDQQQSKDQSDNLLFDFNFFKQQFSLISKPCSLMVKKLEQQLGVMTEKQLQLQK